MPMFDAAQFEDAEKYANYLKTFAGRLRSDLAWHNLQAFLPQGSRPTRALDLGGGTGAVSARLASKDFEVVLLDNAEEMLDIARNQIGAGQSASRVSFLRGDAAQLQQLFAPQSFDLVVCHNVLEFVEDPGSVLRAIAALLRDGGVFSLLLRNRAGEVLKAAIKSLALQDALHNLSAESVLDSLYGKPMRLFDDSYVQQMLGEAGLATLAKYGVRVFSDYRNFDESDNESYQRILQLEIALGARPEFAAIARYIQTISRRSFDGHGD